MNVWGARRELVGLLMILSLAPALAGDVWAAEETSREGAGKESSSESEERERHPLRARLLGATPEERERLEAERKRLSAAAAAFGTDPTAIIGFYQFTYTRVAFTNSLRLDSGTASVQVPITPNWFVRAALPYVWADPNRPRGSTTDGTSDTVVRMGGRLYASPNVALFIGTDATFPTAAKKQLGTGKYTLGPGIGLAVPLPRIRSLFFTVVQDFRSVGGDPSRVELNYMQVQPVINTIWSERWWTLVQGTFYIDWNSNRKTTMNLLGEVGHQFDNRWNVFAAAGAGVVGQDTFLGLDWTVQAGVRWVFRTPLLPETFFGGPLGPDAAR